MLYKVIEHVVKSPLCFVTTKLYTLNIRWSKSSQISSSKSTTLFLPVGFPNRSFGIMFRGTNPTSTNGF